MEDPETDFKLGEHSSDLEVRAKRRGLRVGEDAQTAAKDDRWEELRALIAEHGFCPLVSF